MGAGRSLRQEPEAPSEAVGPIRPRGVTAEKMSLRMNARGQQSLSRLYFRSRFRCRPVLTNFSNHCYIEPAVKGRKLQEKCQRGYRAVTGASVEDQSVAWQKDDVVLGALAGDDRAEIDLVALVGVAFLAAVLVVAQHDDLALGVGGQPAGHGQDLHQLGPGLEVKGAGGGDLAGDVHLARIDLLDDHGDLGGGDELP